VSDRAHDLRSFVHVVLLAMQHDQPLPAVIVDELRTRAEAMTVTLEELFAAAEAEND